MCLSIVSLWTQEKVLLAAIIALTISPGMIGQWSMSFITKQIPELQTEPIQIWFHIFGEILTAQALIVSGIGLLASWLWAPLLRLVAAGMLNYTTFVSPGYFAQQEKWIWVVIFSVLILIFNCIITLGGTGNIR